LWPKREHDRGRGKWGSVSLCSSPCSHSLLCDVDVLSSPSSSVALHTPELTTGPSAPATERRNLPSRSSGPDDCALTNRMPMSPCGNRAITTTQERGTHTGGRGRRLTQSVLKIILEAADSNHQHVSISVGQCARHDCPMYNRRRGP
jgi:hypothetical protein